MLQWIKTSIGWLYGKVREKSPSDQLLMQQLYRGMLEDQQKRFNLTLVEIKAHRVNHPDNGVELDAWEKREHELHRQIIALINENRDLREELIFIKRAT